MIKYGQVIEIRSVGIHLQSQSIRLDDGTFTMFFSDIGYYNRSLKVGDTCKVFYKHSILAGTISYKVHKVKHEKILRIA
jgi:hypothetical protein